MLFSFGVLSEVLQLRQPPLLLARLPLLAGRSRRYRTVLTLYCTILRYTILYCTNAVLYRTVPYCTVLEYRTVYYTVLYRTLLY